MSFWFQKKFPSISLCLVIGCGDEKVTKVKFSPRVFINKNIQLLGCQNIYEFMIATDHVLLLKFEDNEDIVFSDDEWNHVEVSYADHITNKEVSIRDVASFSGIHVLYEQTCPRNVQFCPPETIISVNFKSNSMEMSPQKSVKMVTERSQNDQTMVLSSSILTSTQPPPTDAEKSPALQPMRSFKPLENVIGETSKSVREDEQVYAVTIQNGLPLIGRRHEGNHAKLESVTAWEHQSEESSFNTKGSDSNEPFDLDGRKLSVNGLVAVSPREKSQGSSFNTNGFHSDCPINLVDRKLSVNGHAIISSGDASLVSIREAINSLELLMFKDLSEVSSDPAIQSGLNRLLDVLSIKTVEVQKAIGEFKTKAFASCQEFQSTVESLNKLKSYEKRLDGIRQETAASKGQWSALENSIENISSAIDDENRRKNELEEEIATLKEQQDAKGRDLEQLVLNLKNKEATLSTYSTNCASLNEQAQKLLEEAGYLLAARSEIEDEGEGEAPEVKQNRLKSTWSSDITPHFSKIKHYIFGLDD